MPKPRRRLPRRWPMLKLTDIVTAFRPRERKLCDAAVFRMFGIGDALIFRALVDKNAEALNIPLDEVTVIGSTNWKAAADLFYRDVETVLIDERRFAKNFFYRLSIMKLLRQRGFLVALCGTRYRYPHVVESLMLATGAKRRIIAEARPNEKFDAMFRHYKKHMTEVLAIPENERPRDTNGQPLPLKHEIEHELAFLSAVAGRPVTLSFPPTLEPPQKAAPLVQKGERYAVLNIGSSHAPRRWPLANFTEIARHLIGQGMNVVILGGPSEANLKAELSKVKVEGQGRLIISINELDFGQVAALVNHASLIVSNDTGIGHMALMFGKPSVLLVGGGHFGSFMPYPANLTPANVRFLYHLMPCYHCNWNCTMMKPGDKTFPCVGEISMDAVKLAIAEIGTV